MSTNDLTPNHSADSSIIEDDASQIEAARTFPVRAIVSDQRRAEITSLPEATYTTRRVTAPALEEILYEPIPVLDHGFIRVVDYMGDDSAIVQAARVSYGKGTKQVSIDRGLIRYLLRHRHTTPFEMCEIKFHVKLPIFVARQWIRHRTANVNEYSARYSILDKEFYIPDEKYFNELMAEKVIQKKDETKQTPDLFGADKSAGSLQATAAQSKTNNQGRDEFVSSEEADEYLKQIGLSNEYSYRAYEKLLNEKPDGTIVDPNKKGLARELARMVLPTNIYTQWYWKVDLHNLLHFISLRADTHAQYEIRVYAEAMLDVVKRWVPIVCEAFEDYAVGGAHLSRAGIDIVRRMLAGEAVTQEDSGLPKREWAELMEVLGRD